MLLMICATAVSAQTQTWDSYADEVDARITRLVAEIELFRFRDEHLAMIRSLAYQEAVAVVCPGFATDEARRTDFLSQIVPMRDEELRTAPLESIVLRSEVMFAFGTHFGAAIATGMADPSAFCARAGQDRRDPGFVTPIWQEEK
ncbi:MAG: hypothetical protein ACK4GM_09975 [Tabrizicola sp.]